MSRFPLRLTTLNLNGVRSAASKGVDTWLREQARPDVLCVQEIKARADDLTPALRELGGLRGVFHHAEKPGYSGVGLLWRHEPDEVRLGFGSAEFDPEGRYAEARWRPRGGPELTVVSAYFPSGSSSEQRQAAKYRFLDEFFEHLRELRGRGGEVVVCGDVNIAHKEIDLKNWKGNLKNSGFLPEERAWLSRVLGELGYVDVFRRLDPSPDRYTWWSNRGQARAKNVGWRIDYHLATPGLAERAAAGSAWIYTEQRFSDHAPLTIDYA